LFIDEDVKFVKFVKEKIAQTHKVDGKMNTSMDERCGKQNKRTRWTR
jgi:hypothetical protein